jgi:nitrate reductase gamma subunit
MLITRLTRRDLRDYATPQNYFTYIFLLAVFLSGLYAWVSVDPKFMEYREFWKGLITLEPIDVESASGVHILLFALLLIYLPFTRSLHYVTRLFGFLLIRWDDVPNTKGSLLEKRIKEMLDQKVDWKGPHIKTGSTWSQLASESMSQDKK